MNPGATNPPVAVITRVRGPEADPAVDRYHSSGTAVEATWTAVNAADTEPNLEFQQQTLDITEESFSGTIYFQLSNDEGWPVGQYKVDLYLNGALSQTAEFSVQ